LISISVVRPARMRFVDRTGDGSLFDNSPLIYNILSIDWSYFK